MQQRPRWSRITGCGVGTLAARPPSREPTAGRPAGGSAGYWNVVSIVDSLCVHDSEGVPVSLRARRERHISLLHPAEMSCSVAFT